MPSNKAIRTTRVYKRATGFKLKRASHFDPQEIPRSEMDVCLKCVVQTACSIKDGLHEQECVMNCDYFERG